MSRALRPEEARSCLETRSPRTPDWARAQRFMQTMVWTCCATGREVSVWPGQADSGASSESHGPDALAVAGSARTAAAIAARPRFRVHAERQRVLAPIPGRI